MPVLEAARGIPQLSRRRAVVLVVSALVVLGSWLLSAPPGASPDDGYHLASIWCAEGFKDGLCMEDPGAPDLSRVLIPMGVTDVNCFQHDGRRSAACALESLTSPASGRLSPVRASNIRGERPNLYYRAMHQLISDDLAVSTMRMRIANLLVVILMVGGASVVATPAVRRALLLSFAVVSVPLGLFLMTSLNTSAWGLAGLATFWANALTVLTHPQRWNRIAASGLAVLSLALGLGSRTEAGIHISVTIVVLAILWLGASRQALRGERGEGLLGDRKVQALIVGAVLLTIGAIVALAPRSAGLSGVLADIGDGYNRLAGRGIGDPFLAIAFEVPSLWTGALGHVWGLGALDTPIPMLATLPIAGIFVALFTLGIQRSSRPRTAAVTTIGVALFAFPMFALMRSGLLVYEQLQPRQFMVLLYVLLGFAALSFRDDTGLVVTPTMRAVTVSGLTMAHAVALLVTMRRHITGLVEFRYVSFSSEIEWWWSFGPGPNTVWAVASIAYGILIAAVIGLFREQQPAAVQERSG